jgi:hypothetical protein
VARRLVVEAEIRACMPDLAQAAFELYPAPFARADRSERPLRLICGLQRIARQQVLQVAEDQLLVLLLVLQSELDERLGLGAQAGSAEQRDHGPVDIVAVGDHLGQGRAREHAALGPRMPRADRVVVGVVQHAVRRLEYPIAGQVRLEHESLEEPGGVGEMPLHRARVRHRLDCAVLGGERRGQAARYLSDQAIALAARPAGSDAGRSGGRVEGRNHGRPLGTACGALSSALRRFP